MTLLGQGVCAFYILIATHGEIASKRAVTA